MSSDPQPFFAPDAQPHFKHEALLDARKFIRLLTLHSGQNDEPLRASLTPQPLSHDLHFEALSYMWGPSEPKQLFQLNEQEFLLRPNIHAFLRRLRYHSKDRVLWLDAVCIDQNNISERGDQVSLMREIYSSCRQCLVWLGESIPRGDEVIEMFAGNPVDEQGMTDLNNLIFLLYRHDLAESFRALLTNDYWSRVWMIQETTLPAKVIVHLGGSSCLLDNVPTQVRARMFDLFQESRAQYQEWLKVFNQDTGNCDLRAMPTGILSQLEADTGDEIFPGLVGQALRQKQREHLLGFRRPRDKGRWEPVAAEAETINNEGDIHVTFHSTISLSSVSDLSFSTTNFDPIAAFKSINCAFWCIENTRSEQLLNERRRYSTSNNRQFSSMDFRNYLEDADRWHCTDIRDRVFGALGVFGVWPRAYPFRADYNLVPEELLVAVVDYARPTDPFKLAIRLIKALQVQPEAFDTVPRGRFPTVTLMSRISWPMDLFHAVRLPTSPDAPYSARRLQRSDAPHSAQGFLYVSPQGLEPQPSDALASMGDGSVVVGIRQASSDCAQQWSRVGFGFDTSATDGSLTRDTTAALANVEEEKLRGLVLNLPRFSVRPAAPEDKSNDGVPALWWISCPSEWFWYLCQREQQIRAETLESDDGLGGDSDMEGSAAAVGGGLSSGRLSLS